MCVSIKRFQLLLLTFLITGFSALQAQSKKQVNQLQELSNQFQTQWQAERAEAEQRAQAAGIPVKQVLPTGQVMELQRFENDMPVYYITTNVDAAESSSTDELWPGGATSFDLTGSTETLGIWDAGKVRDTHQEFGSRVTQQDGATDLHDHATHVAGTMIAGGTDPDAQGMAYEANLDAYDWNSDNSEMSSAAANGLRISNHSYGQVHGWEFDNDESTWYWYGDTTVSRTEDHQLGLYDAAAQSWDQIANNAPKYVIVKSAGNDQTQGPSSQPVQHKVWDKSQGQWVNSSSVRDLDGGTSGYGSLGQKATSKNVITMGAAFDISGGYSTPSDVTIAGFSSMGPTDDGRIKPDIVANGTGLKSPISTGDTDYDSYSGTSMSSPATSGSIGLLQQLYTSLHNGTYPLASTIKALFIHTADEAGSNEGPDYMFGWGMLNTQRAAEVIDQDANSAPLTHIREITLNDGDTKEYVVWSDGEEPLKATIAWNDPAGTPSSTILNPTDKMLVNDLDVRIFDDNGDEYKPYILDGTNPTSAATKADNDVDNVEQVYIDAPYKGFYTIRINHKGSLTNGSQDVSLITTGNATTPGHLAFDGEGYLEVPSSSSVDVSGNFMTVEFWVKFDPTSDEDAIILTRKVDGGDGYQVRLVGNGEQRRIHFATTWRTGTNVTSTTGIPANTWTHVAAVYNDGLVQIYFNGELDAEKQGSSTALGSNVLPLIVGANHAKNGQFFRGAVDNIRIFSRAKTLFEIRDNFTSELEGNETSLQAYLKMNIDQQGQITDFSGNGNTGTMVNQVAAAEPNVFPLAPVVHGKIEDQAVKLKINERSFATGVATEYRVYRNAGGLSSQVATINSITSDLIYDDGGRVNTVTYNYTVTLVDSEGNESDFSTPLSLTPNQQRGGTSVDFTDQGYLDFGYVPELDVDGAHMTIMFWIKRDSMTTNGVQSILSNKNDGSDGYDIYLEGSGEETYLTADMAWRSGLNVTTNSGIRAGVWTHVAIVYNDGSTHIYLNGELDAETTGTATNLGSRSNPFIVGSNQAKNGEFLKGQLDELRIYNTSRTVAQIQSDFNKVLWGDEEGLVGYWRFDHMDENIAASKTMRPISTTPVGSVNRLEPGVFPLPPTIHVKPSGSGNYVWVEQQEMASSYVSEYKIFRSAQNQSPQELTTITGNQFLDTSADDSVTYTYSATIVDTYNGESDFRYPVVATDYNDQLAGHAVRFETNQNAHIQYEYNPSLDIPGNQMTVEVWVNKDAASQAGAFILGNKNDGSHGYQMNFVDAGDSSRVRFDPAWRSGLNVTTNTYLKPGKWYHIAAVYDAGNTHIYVNGALENSSSGTDTNLNRNDNPLVIGANQEGTDNYFIGELDEVRIYDIAIAKTVIAERYNKPLLGNEDGLVGYWRFDELEGTIAHSSAKRPMEGLLRNGARFVPSAAMEGDPYIPLLAAPIDDAVDQPRPLTFKWHPIDNAQHYELEISKTLAFESVILKKEIQDTTIAVELGLDYDSTYHWRVRAVTNQFETNWSNKRTFTMELPVPATPEWDPNDGATNVSTSPLLSWGEADRAETYRVQLSTQSDFSSTLVDSSGIEQTKLAVDGLETGTTYHWRVLASNKTGDSNWSDAIQFETTVTALKDLETPDDFKLGQNYPNPFNPTTQIQFSLPKSSIVKLEVYNMLGERVAVLLNGERRGSGHHKVPFNGENLSSGMYIYRMQAGSFVDTGKMLLIK